MGCGIGVGLTGLGATSAVGRNPGAATPILVQAILAIALTEAIVFYALFLVNNRVAAAHARIDMDTTISPRLTSRGVAK